MHIGRFKLNKKIFYGLVDKQKVYVLKGDIFKKYSITKIKYDLNKLKSLTPTEPTKIILVGLNYRDHAQEMNLAIPEEPVIFMKPATSVIGHNENIIYPASSQRVDYEAELGLIIKKLCYKVKRSEAYDYILGYTCLNDVTARDLQKKDGQWTRAKSFNTFCPIGPFILIPDKNFDPHNLHIKAILNNEINQDSNTNNLIFRIDYLVEYISHIMSLYPGDIISTGTPGGIGPMHPGDTITIEVEKVGRLTNKVIRE